MEINTYTMYPGNETRGFPYNFARSVYRGQPLFHHRNFDEFYLSTRALINDTNRWEYVVTDGHEYNVVASMAVYRERDMHVGDCLSVLVAFSTEPRALVGGYIWLRNLARELGVPFIAYTKAISPYEMVLKYKKVL